ncbi:MAG: hypothetical protein IJ824_00870 [Alphaproteobacteria bacterium]|nr:hypothetical protein [Alphaproteobacteria bacterium]
MNTTTLLIYAVAAIIGFYIFRFIIKIPFYLFGLALLCGIGWFLFYHLYPLLGN